MGISVNTVQVTACLARPSRKRHCSSHGSFLNGLLCGESATRPGVAQTLEMPPWRGAEVSCQQLAPPCQPRKSTAVALVELGHGCRPGLHLMVVSWGPWSPNCPAKPNFRALEAGGANKLLEATHLSHGNGELTQCFKKKKKKKSCDWHFYCKSMPSSI